jgi:glycosyltransferase
MKVTIITATYNSEHTIESCMNSVLQQSYIDIEYLIIDGASTDGTLTKVNVLSQKNEQREIRVISEPDKGIYDALNKGVSLSTGDIIGFVHSDDFLAKKDVLARVVEQFNVNDGVGGVYGDLHYVDKKNKVVRLWKSRNFKPSLLRSGWMPAHPTLFLKKEIYEKHGQFDLAYKIAADYDFMLRVLKDEKIRFNYLPTIITKMRVGGASNKSLKNIISKSIEDYKVIKTNQVGFPIAVLVRKNLSKVSQFFIKDKHVK